MEERNDSDKANEVMLPGFRFHPTDEELVGFYLRRKVQQKPLSVELIRQLDIYKYDPWDLPKLATTGEKEWYFYCPRDRKYRNSARPNRVTGAGFWKATGTDRPVYSSRGSKCIGLKKSLVFYKGRAAKGVKTGWMMHEFRLPSVSDSMTPKKYLDKSIPANEAWAICKIFEKANSSARRGISHSWDSQGLVGTTSHMTSLPSVNNFQFSSNNVTMENKTSSPLQYSFYHDIQQSSMANFIPIHSPPTKPVYQMESQKPCQLSQQAPKCGIIGASSFLADTISTSMFGGFAKSCSDSADFIALHQQHRNRFSATMTGNMEGNLCQEGETTAVLVKDHNVGNPCSFPLSLLDAWKSNFLWDSSPCPSEPSTSYSTNKIYT